jgi:short-subunit dehydrogenase
MESLKPVTLITGASAGIGAAFADIFAEHDHEIVLVARQQERLESVADAIAARGRARPSVIALDLTRDGATDQLADELQARGLEPSVVVNSAGFGLRGQASELDRKEQLGIIDLNIRVLTDLSLRWVDSMLRHAGGLINVSSLASFWPGPGMAIYYASKAYVTSFTEALHQELSPRGVKVTAVCPGPVITSFHARAGLDQAQLPRIITRTSGRVAREGYEGFMRNERIVITGTACKIVAFVPRLLPRRLALKLAETYQFK